jgi:hypothetical protein
MQHQKDNLGVMELRNDFLVFVQVVHIDYFVAVALQKKLKD